jgi:hypothetical protein
MEDERKVKEASTEEATQEELFPQGEQQKKLTKPISEEEFRKQIHEAAIANYNKVIEYFEKGILHLRDYSGVKKFKSIRRAIRRGHVSIFGEVYPQRPFKNIKSKKGNIAYTKKGPYE